MIPGIILVIRQTFFGLCRWIISLPALPEWRIPISMHDRKKWLMFSAWVSVVSFLLFFGFGKIYSRTLNEILNFGHLVLFGCTALLLLRMFRKTPGEQGPAPYGKAAVTTMLMGILSEFIQLLTPDREFQLRDMFADGVGAVTFLAIAFSLRGDMPGWKKRLIRSASLLLILLMLGPLLYAAIDDRCLLRDFPLLASFESPLEMSRWAVEGGNSIERVKQHASEGVFSMKTVLATGPYPGIALEHFLPDWSGYASLGFDVFSEQAAPLKLTVRINDRMHNEQYNDRYNETFQLHPGINRISISLDKVRNAPKGRKMDMAAIKSLCIFTTGLKDPRIIYLDNVRLKNYPPCYRPR